MTTKSAVQILKTFDLNGLRNKLETTIMREELDIRQNRAETTRAEYLRTVAETFQRTDAIAHYFRRGYSNQHDLRRFTEFRDDPDLTLTEFEHLELIIETIVKGMLDHD